MHDQAHRHAGGGVDPPPERSSVWSVFDHWHPVIDSNGDAREDSKRFGTVRMPPSYDSIFRMKD